MQVINQSKLNKYSVMKNSTLKSGRERGYINVGPARVIATIKKSIVNNLSSKSGKDNIGLIVTVGFAILVAFIFVWILTK